MVGIKNKLFEKDPSNPINIQKIAFYVNTGVEILEAFLESSIEISEKMEAYYLMAQLQSKYFSPDVDQQTTYTKKAIKAYGEVIEVYEGQQGGTCLILSL